MNFDRFEKRRKEKGLSASFLCVQAGKSNHYVHDYKKTGKVAPAIKGKPVSYGDMLAGFSAI